MQTLPMDSLRRAEATAKMLLLGAMLRSGLLVATILFFVILALVCVLPD